MRKEITLINDDAHSSDWGKVYAMFKTFPPDATVYIRMDNSKAYTDRQRNSIHLYCRWIAAAFNEAGQLYTFSSFLGDKEISIPYTMDIVMESIWKPTQLAHFKTTSLTELTTEQVGKLAEVLSMALAKAGYDIPFPSEDDLGNKWQEL